MKIDKMAGVETPANSPRMQPLSHKVAGAAQPNIPHTQIKICGLTSAQDAMAAADCGADAIGLVFYPPSVRNIDVAQAAEVLQSLPPFVTVTGLFLNAEKSVIDKILQQLPLSLLQFHGTESAEFCQSFERPYIKSVGMKSVSDIKTYTDQFKLARGFLLDSNVSGGAGGSGETFDWSLIPTSFPAPLVLAGGLDSNNVYDAVLKVRPAAVDVSSGVESGKGIKDHAMMRNFIQNVRAADKAIGVINQSSAGDL